MTAINVWQRGGMDARVGPPKGRLVTTNLTEEEKEVGQ
jgi:hypothetical protein